MPTYEYRCEQCHYRYEKREGFDAPSLQPCPQCNGTARRIFYPPPIVFKGPGFYNTDNRRSVRTDGKAEAKSTSEATDNGHEPASSTATKANEPAAAE